MAQSISYSTAIVVLVIALLSFTCASRHILQSEEVTPLDISKEEGSRVAEMMGYATTGEESDREVPTGPDPIHHHGIPKTRSAYLPKRFWPNSNTNKSVADQYP
ncbi:hypothetical protein FCM35_KLT21924 [Carex littledalei]|uniref:Uncharacterized protein n=1 Tax=Carex littledalei TaxID=544730 RepID=A0A833QFE1_9POAL|nr:hypothetical protein FCM35_KLT21924 [Carex littledalei]